MLHVFPILLTAQWYLVMICLFVFCSGQPIHLHFHFHFWWDWDRVNIYVDVWKGRSHQSGHDHRYWDMCRPQNMKGHAACSQTLSNDMKWYAIWWFGKGTFQILGFLFKIHTHLFFLVSTCICYVLLLLQLFEEHVPHIPVSVSWPVRKHWLCRWLLVQCCTPRPLARLPFV